MTSLNRKLARDLWQLRGQGLAVSLVMGCGVATFVMSLSTLISLQRLQSDYYDRYYFADVFTHVKRAPLSLIEQIRKIPGVGTVEPRIAETVTLDLPGLPEPAAARIVSLPDHRPLALNRLHLRQGRYPQPGNRREVLIAEAFAEANRFQPGDRLAAVLNGRWEQLQIVGIALSPEFIYSIREGELLPDNRRFGILWMPEEELARAFDLEGAFNDVCLSLEPEAIEAEVLRRLDTITAPYGGIGACGREDQVSAKFLENELIQLRGMGLIAPVLFLSVAAFLMNVILARLVATQRAQIAMLKAFGYTRWEVTGHYLKLVLLLVFVGNLAGIVGGVWLGWGMTQVYARFFRFPWFDYRLEWLAPVWALLVSTAAALAGTLHAAAQAGRLPPAQAMRPEAPHQYLPLWTDNVVLRWLLSPVLRMILRQLQRRPLKTLFTTLGISLAVSVYVLGAFLQDSVEYVIDFQFEQTQRYDLAVSFREPASERVMHELSHLPGVLRAEPVRTVTARLRHGNRSRRLAIVGLKEDRRLFEIIDSNGHVSSLPDEGLLISSKLAEILEIAPGDELQVEVLEGKRTIHSVPVSGLLTDFAGMSAYMRLRAVQNLLHEGESISGAHLAVDPQELAHLYRHFKEAPNLGGLVIKQATLDSFRQTIAENLLRMRAVIILFAATIAMGVVYNSARISLAERCRDLATLRVIGFTQREVSRILLGEQALVTLLALPVGLLLGWCFAWLTMRSLDTEIHRFPVYVAPGTYAAAVLVTLTATAASALLVRRRLGKLDLVAVLKAQD